MRKLLVLAMTVLSFSFVLLGCSYQPNENADVEAAAKVNGKVAPVWQYDFYYNQGKGYMQQYGMDLTAESPETKSMLAMLEQNAWEAIINNQIIQQAADEMNIKVKSSEVKKLFEENIRSSFEKDEDYQKWLTDSSMSEDNVLQVIALQEIHRKLFEEVTKEQNVSAEKAKAAYDKAPQEWNTRKVSHILISANKETATEQELAAAKKKAEETIVRLQKGEDFATVAKEVSGDPGSAQNGGILDYEFTSLDTRLMKEFVAGAYQLAKVGDISAQPVQTNAGYHIIKLDGKKEGFTDLQETIIEKLSGDAKNEHFSKFIKEKRDAAKVERIMTFKDWAEGNKL